MRSNPLDIIRNRRRSDEGFTLIELLVVVVILGILIGIAIPVYLNYRKSANDKAAQSDVRNAVSTLELCNSDGAYPTSVPAAGGKLDATANGCTQTISISADTSLVYVAPTSTNPNYLIFGANKGGSKLAYCYDSAKGGGVKKSTTATVSDAGVISGATACP